MAPSQFSHDGRGADLPAITVEIPVSEIRL